jgi:Protein of unknown function (DUF2846)
MTKCTMTILTVTLLAVACATTTMAPPAQDVAAKQFVAPLGKARVYVTRPGTQGAAGLANVTIDGRLVGQLAIQTYVYMDLEPGEHSIAWSGVHPFTVRSGDVVFFRIRNLGLFRRDDDADGRAAVLASTLVQATP